MTVGILPTTKLIPVIFDSPPDNFQFVSSSYLIWDTGLNDFLVGSGGHFELQISTNPAFSTLALHPVSLLSVIGFEYEQSSNVWVALPVSGLAAADVGKRVRYLVSGLPVNTYYWRVRALEQV